jgi:RNA polymerase sigma-70 factor (ECF subfamily)
MPQQSRSAEQIYDELLVMQSGEGDERAFAELVKRWQGRLYGHALQLTGRPDAAMDAVRVHEALAQLPSDRRTLLVLHYLHDLSVAEIASTLRLPIGTVKSRMHAARAQLKGALNQERREPCPS